MHAIILCCHDMTVHYRSCSTIDMSMCQEGKGYYPGIEYSCATKGAKAPDIIHGTTTSQVTMHYMFLSNEYCMCNTGYFLYPQFTDVS